MDERLRIRRIELVYPTKAALGFLGVAHTSQHKPEVVQSRNVVRLHPQGAAILLRRTLEVAGLLARVAEILERLRIHFRDFRRYPSGPVESPPACSSGSAHGFPLPARPRTRLRMPWRRGGSAPTCPRAANPHGPSKRSGAR